MIRISAVAAILVVSTFLIAVPAHAQPDGRSADNQCFPWQEFKNGRCVPKGAPAEPPLMPSISNCGSRSLSGQCACPDNQHWDAVSSACIANADAATSDQNPAATQAISCNGGTLSGETCTCPAGFKLMGASANAGGGTCVKTDALNCLGGQLTVGGKCLCNGQVTMSGETYDLEYSNGKCVPKRCPVLTVMRDGQCTSSTATFKKPEPEAKSRHASHKLSSLDEGEERPRCGRGLFRAHSACAAARQRSHGLLGGEYYKLYRQYVPQ
jgi:hypothetical protein